MVGEAVHAPTCAGVGEGRHEKMRGESGACAPSTPSTYICSQGLEEG